MVCPNLKEDSVVHLDTGGRPKYVWQLGRVVDIYPGKDGHVRALGIALIVFQREQGTIPSPALQENTLVFWVVAISMPCVGTIAAAGCVAGPYFPRTEGTSF